MKLSTYLLISFFFLFMIIGWLFRSSRYFTAQKICLHCKKTWHPECDSHPFRNPYGINDLLPYCILRQSLTPEERKRLEKKIDELM